MKICEKCRNEFTETTEKGRPVHRYTHCDECYSDVLIGDMQALAEGIQILKEG